MRTEERGRQVRSGEERNIRTTRKVGVAEIDGNTDLLTLGARLVNSTHSLHENVTSSQHALRAHAVDQNLGITQHCSFNKWHALQVVYTRTDGFGRRDDDQFRNRLVKVGNNGIPPLFLQHIVKGSKQGFHQLQLFVTIHSFIPYCILSGDGQQIDTNARIPTADVRFKALTVEPDMTVCIYC